MDKRTQTLPTRSGFTLVELLIVIIVLALLTVVSGTAYTATMKTARDGRRKIDLESIRSALEVYRSDHSTYPDTEDGSSSLASFLETGSKKYISMPKDPKTKTDYYYIPADCEEINSVNICNSYILAVALENDPGNPPDECTGLFLPTTGDFACRDTENNAAMCNYCVDPYGQLTPTPFAPGPPPG
jgi:general secretion pathway protein G